MPWRRPWRVATSGSPYLEALVATVREEMAAKRDRSAPAELVDLSWGFAHGIDNGDRIAVFTRCGSYISNAQRRA